MTKIKFTRAFAIALAGFSCTAMAADPAFTTRAYNLTNEVNQEGDPLNVGGNSVTSGGRWAAITDVETCALNIYVQDQETLSWEFAQEIVESKFAGCTNTGYGLSSSISGNLLVVGAPLAGSGRLFIYAYDGTSWVRFVNAAKPGIIQGTQAARWGNSVSVSQRPGTTDYLIAVGAPFFDNESINPPVVDAGLVELYTYTEGDNKPVFFGFTVGTSANEFLGQSVTTNWPFSMGGAPGATFDGQKEAGKAVIENSSVPFTELGIPSPGGTFKILGQEVSLSDRYALMSGGAPGFTAFAWENQNTASSPNWVLGPNTFITDGGDVSQSGGITAFGNVEAGGTDDGSVNIYRDPIGDDVSTDRIEVDVSADYGPGSANPSDLTDIGIDIRINRESLWLANSTWDAPGGTGDEGQAILYQYPCAYGTELVAFEWKIIGIPCTAGDGTVNDVFGNLTGAWEVWGIDETGDLTLQQPATLLAGTDTLDQNRAYWVITDTTQYFAFGSNTNPQFTSAILDISSVPPDSADRARGRSIPAPTDNGGPGLPFGRIMISNPFSRSFAWEDLRFIQSTYKTLAQAEIDRQMLATGYVYDLDSVNATGQNYRAVTATPGFDNEIQPLQGFWVRILEAHLPNEALIIPRPR